MSEKRIQEETVWTVKIGDVVTITHDGHPYLMSFRNDLRMVGLEIGSKLMKTIEAMPEVGAKTLKMVVSWE